MTFFDKKIGPVKLWWLCTLWGVLLVGILVGSFCDLSLSRAIASQDDVYGKLFESFGELFGFAMAPLATGILSSALIRRGSKRRYVILAVAVSLVGVLSSAYFSSGSFCGKAGYSWYFPRPVAFVGALVVEGGAWFLGYRLTDKTLPRRTVIGAAVCILVAFIVPVVLVNYGFKGLVYRPRYRALMWNNELLGTSAMGTDYYRNWWNFCFWKKPDWFTALGLPDDYIKSWPSGHTAAAAVTLALPYAVSVFKRPTDKKIALWFCLAVVYTLTVAVARIVNGAHYLTDVCFGGLLSSVLATLGCRIVTRCLAER